MPGRGKRRAFWRRVRAARRRNGDRLPVHRPHLPSRRTPGRCGGQCQGRSEAEIGLDYYVARFYDLRPGTSSQADTVVPEAGSSKAYNRYEDVNWNPVRYNDPGRRLLTGVRFDPRLDPSEGSGTW